MRPRTAIVATLICVVGAGVGLLVRRGAGAEAEGPAGAAAARGADGRRGVLRLHGSPALEDAPAPSGALEPAEYHPRDPNEWQGMLVNTTLQPECARSEQCGLAMACIEGRCGACRNDAQCDGGEVCVIDHCVPATQVTCRSRRDCAGSESFCILSGYSSDPRGNDEMTAFCQEASGGREQDFADLELPHGVPAEPMPVQPSDLLDSLPVGDDASEG